MTIKDKIAVMEAFARGRSIQYKTPLGREYYIWRDVEEPKWNWEECDYRVKPKLVDYKKIKVRIYSLKEALKVMVKLRSYHYEGMYNDSFKYCSLEVKRALECGVCYICVNAGAEGACVRISCAHDKRHKEYLEVSISRFLELTKLVNKTWIDNKCWDTVVYDCEQNKQVVL